MSKTKRFIEQCAADWGMTTDQYIAWVSRWNAEEQEYAAIQQALPGREGCPACNAYYCADAEGQVHVYDCGSTTNVHGRLTQSAACKERVSHA